MQCPVELKRNRGFTGDEKWKECIDVHWMAYYDGSCTWEDITNNKLGAEHENNFFIRRHALQVMMPLDTKGNLKCTPGERIGDNPGPLFPKLDYSKGFPEYWFLSHLESKTPSEWVQEGVKYDAEITMSQFYERPWGDQPKGGPQKKIGNVVVMVQGMKRIEPNPFIDKIICQFRKTEDDVRKQCGRESITEEYPGCWQYSRSSNESRNLRPNTETIPPPEPRMAIPDSNHIHVDEANFSEERPYDFEEYIDHVIREEESNQEPDPSHRKLMNYDHVPFHAYQPLTDVRTEYYYRVDGMTTTPPCQAYTHYRIMKDPLRISMRQLEEIQRLLAMRVAPKGSLANECEDDTAGIIVEENRKVDVSRPLQIRGSTNDHKMMFCECKDWKSKWRQDREWCKIEDEQDRFYEQPYNFASRSGDAPFVP